MCLCVADSDCSLSLCEEFLLKEEDYNAIWEASAWKNYGANIADREQDLEMDRMKIEGKLAARRTELQEELNGILSSIHKFKDKGQIRYLDEYLDDLQSIKRNLASLQARSHLRNRHVSFSQL